MELGFFFRDPWIGITKSLTNFIIYPLRFVFIQCFRVWIWWFDLLLGLAFLGWFWDESRFLVVTLLGVLCLVLRSEDLDCSATCREVWAVGWIWSVLLGEGWEGFE